MKKKSWHEYEIGLEDWMHKHLAFRSDVEFAIFLVWMLFVGVFISTLGF